MKTFKSIFENPDKTGLLKVAPYALILPETNSLVAIKVIDALSEPAYIKGLDSTSSKAVLENPDMALESRFSEMYITVPNQENIPNFLTTADFKRYALVKKDSDEATFKLIPNKYIWNWTSITPAKISFLVFAKDGCPYCEKAKALLKEKELPHHVITVTPDIVREVFAELDIYTNEYSTYPLIFEKMKFVGGYDDLKKIY